MRGIIPPQVIQKQPLDTNPITKEFEFTSNLLSHGIPYFFVLYTRTKFPFSFLKSSSGFPKSIWSLLKGLPINLLNFWFSFSTMDYVFCFIVLHPEVRENKMKLKIINLEIFIININSLIVA